MAVYSFKDKTTGEEFELSMPMSDREDFLALNPHIEQVLKVMNLVDPVGIGVTKPPSDFQKHVVKRIADNVPGAVAVGNKRWGAPREW